MADHLLVTIDLDWGTEADLVALIDPLMDFIMGFGRDNGNGEFHHKFGVSTTLATHEEEDDR